MDEKNFTEDYTMYVENTSSEFTNYSLEPTKIATSIGAAIMSFFLALGLLGNFWIIVAITTKRGLASIINVFIISLIINDLLTYFMVVVFIIDSFAAHGWNAGDTMCQLNPELTVLFTGCSLWHTALIAIHRYIVVCHNHLYKRMSKTAYVTFVLIATRAIPASCVFPGFSLSKNIYYHKMLRCLLGPLQKTRMVYITMAQIILPCIIVLVCYALVFAFVHRISRHIHQTNMILKREIQITKMFGMVFLTIMLGFIPYAVLRNADRGNIFSADVYVVATVVYAIASCSNPIVYGAMSTDIRSTCLACLKGALRCLNIGQCMICIKFDPVQNSGPEEVTNVVEYNLTEYCCSRPSRIQVVPSSEALVEKKDSCNVNGTMNTVTCGNGRTSDQRTSEQDQSVPSVVVKERNDSPNRVEDL